ncbi:M81 family metallopeptidase [Pseudohaliea sp.]|uniref:M81 family metallopeptidase n=1 Tax=Pseudohaliea sp. TaxID=2740289 RepID=UPI0032EEF80D
MRVYGACLATETNTFNATPTRYADFNVIDRADLLSGKVGFEQVQPIGFWRDWTEAAGGEYTPGLHGFAQPAGKTVQEDYELLKSMLVEDIEATGPFDIILLFLHGAMVAEQVDDCEADILTAVRGTSSGHAVVGVFLDLHSHLTPEMLSLADLFVSHKEYPHTDVEPRAREVFDLSLAAYRSSVRPVMEMFDCQMIGMYPTNLSPMEGFVRQLQHCERRPGVLSVSLCHGFPFGDVASGGTKVLVVADNDRELAKTTAQELGREIYALRTQIGFPSLDLAAGMSRALAACKAEQVGPVVVADQSDNPGGGAPGDATFMLESILNQGLDNAAYAMIYDPESVAVCASATINAEVDLVVGGRLDPVNSGKPLALRATLLGFLPDYQHRFPQPGGGAQYWPAGDIAMIRSAGVTIILCSVRGQCFSPCIFDDLGVDARTFQLIGVKSNQHFYRAFAPIASEIIYIAGPGAVPPVAGRLNFAKMSTFDKFPWNPDPLGLGDALVGSFE